MEKVASTIIAPRLIKQQIECIISIIKTFSFLDWLSLLNFLTIFGSFFTMYFVSETIFTGMVNMGIVLSVLPYALSLIIKKERNSFKLASLVAGILAWGAWFIIIRA